MAQCYPVYSEDKASRSLNGGKGKMTSPSVRGSNVFVSSLRSSERERRLHSDERQEEGAAERKKHRREETETERYSSSRDGDQRAAAAAPILSENAGASGLRRGDYDAVVYSRNFRIVFGHPCVRCVGLSRFGSSLCLSFLLSLFGAETRRIKGHNGGYS